MKKYKIVITVESKKNMDAIMTLVVQALKLNKFIIDTYDLEEVEVLDITE